MKNYVIKPFEEDNFCLCVSLQAIFKRHGLNLSQREIASNLTPSLDDITSSHTGFYANDYAITDFLKSKGFLYRYHPHNQTPFNERDDVLEEMHENDGIIGMPFMEHPHIYLLRGFVYPLVETIDPWSKEIIQKDYYAFLKDMEKNDGFFGLIKRMS